MKTARREITETAQLSANGAALSENFDASPMPAVREIYAARGALGKVPLICRKLSLYNYAMNQLAGASKFKL